MSSDFSKFRWIELAIRMTKGITAQVATEMFNRANMDGTKVYINNEKLARELGCNEKSIRRARKDIESKQLGRIVRLGHNMVDGSSRTSSEYQLTMPSQPDIATQPDKPQVSPQLDIPVSGKHAGHSTTGHPPHNRTSVSPQPDTHVHLIEPGNKPGSSSKRKPDTDMSGVVASLPVGEGQEQSEPSEDVSSLTAVGTPQSVPQPDIESMSGVNDPQPATESEAMNNTDPWANTSVRLAETPTAPSGLGPQWLGWTVVPWPDDKMPPRQGQPGYAGSRAVFVSELDGTLIGISPTPAVGVATVRSEFVGPETDPKTGGPNWEQGPLQP